ncbi:MAG: DUF4402 domain-containing protein [Alphaproteobacteria bacterium]|nr:DUF4402 domain-containing protein [Alphaproteobacteria bacterium]MBN2779966.1 DUF4402 domain-containing protein [Alphaproteobacteria bacterium]
MIFFYLLLFVFTAFFSFNVFAATGRGEAQAELTSPLAVSGDMVYFGEIAIDPASGPQMISIDIGSNITCPQTYVCTGFKRRGYANITGAPNSLVTLDISGSTALLSDGNGHTIVFDPTLSIFGDTRSFSLNTEGKASSYVVGDLYFTGNEPAGFYSSQNAGGSGYIINVNY